MQTCPLGTGVTQGRKLPVYFCRHSRICHTSNELPAPEIEFNDSDESADPAAFCWPMKKPVSGVSEFI